MQGLARFILPRQPSMHVCLGCMRRLELCSSFGGLFGALLGQSEQTLGRARNQLGEEILEHPGRPVVRHDPHTETRPPASGHLEALLRNGCRQRWEALLAAVADSSPLLVRIAVGVDYGPQRFKARCRQLAFYGAGLQHLFDAIARLDVDDRPTVRVPRNAVGFQEERHDALVRIALDKQFLREDAPHHRISKPRSATMAMASPLIATARLLSCSMRWMVTPSVGAASAFVTAARLS